MPLLFKDDQTFFATDERTRMALLLSALELRYRFACTSVWASEQGCEIVVGAEVPEDKFIWETNVERLRYWAHSSVLQSRLMTARYGIPIAITFWAVGMWTPPLGAVRVDQVVVTPTEKPAVVPAGVVGLPEPSQARAKPKEPAFHVAVGCALYMHGKIEFAKEAFRKALVLDEDYADAWFHLGNMYYVELDYAKAVIYYRAALKCNSEHVLAWQSLGNALCSLQSYGPGMVCYNKAMSIDAESPGLKHNMGNALIGMKKYVEAEARLREALAADPAQEKTYNTLGNLYFSRSDYPAAAAHYEVCVLMRPSYGPAHTNLGNALLSMHDGPRAIQCYETGLKFDPSSAGVRYNLGLAYLREGRWAEGWRAHEARWDFKELKIPKRKFKVPLWDGRQFSGKTLLVYAEQGLGDTIQFCRYIDQVVALAGSGKIVFEVQERVERLMRYNFSLDGLVEVVKRNDPLPHYDLRVPLMSLPLIFGTDLKTLIAPDKYLNWPRQHWTISAPMVIGLSWAGNPKYKADNLRSIPVKMLTALPKHDSVQYMSLQREKPEDVALLQEHFGTAISIPADPEDFADTAAVIAGLDIVLTSDTAVAHLAGAMGKTVWLMLCYLADWRWLNRGWEHSPWYPTMHIFRQERDGDWSNVIQRVGNTIENLVAVYS